MKRLVVAAALFLLASASFAAGPFIQAHGPKVPGQYLVVFDAAHPASQVAQQAASEHGGTVVETWEHATNGALVAGMSEQQARALARNPWVRWVEEDGIVHVDATQTNPPSWGLDRIDQRNLPLDSSYTYNFDGTGVHAYIIDTGIRDTHVDFGGRASRDFDSVGDGQNGNDCYGHGTHVAGTVGGATYGVAKNVRLHAVRVLDCNGSGTVSGVVSGVDWVASNAIHPAVANMSLGGGASTTLDNAVNNAVASGVFFAIAAGNSNADACNSSPARAAQAFTVGATTQSDARSSFSNFGSCVNIFAPGSSITSTWNTSDTATNTISGTSMATPHVAGVAALILDENPGFTVDQVKNELTTIATSGVLSGVGSGSPNLLLHSLTSSGGGCTITENPEQTCNDGIDNDCDGLIDGNDPDCQASCTPTENPEVSCSDGIDNDCDGLVDSNDPDCAPACLGQFQGCTSNSQCCSGNCFFGIVCI